MATGKRLVAVGRIGPAKRERHMGGKGQEDARITAARAALGNYEAHYRSCTDLAEGLRALLSYVDEISQCASCCGGVQDHPAMIDDGPDACSTYVAARDADIASMSNCPVCCPGDQQ